MIHARHLVLSLVFGASLLLNGTGAVLATEPLEPGVNTITGTVTITTPFIGRAFTQPFILLTDLTAFVHRDLLAPLPSPVQITGNLEGKLDEGARFTVSLPIKPLGIGHDFATGSEVEDGVQVYAVDFQVNLVGDPFLSDLETTGWPTALSSVRVEMGSNEVFGGSVTVWSPKEAEFPTGFGPDGNLFTEDDPLGPLDAGWTVIDLESEPFARIRDASVEVEIIEGEVGLRDLSQLGWTEAFDALVAELRVRYPFTELKAIDWDALIAEFRPQIEAAEQAQDATAFNLALLAFGEQLHDGHVWVQLPEGYFDREIGGSYGFALGMTDSGEIVVRCVGEKTSAQKAGILPGAVITAWDGASAADALAAIDPIFSESTDAGLLDQKLSLLARGPVGTKVVVTFLNPGETEPRKEKVKTQEDIAGVTPACARQLAGPAEMPVEVRVLPSGLGYVAVNTFSDDLTLTLQSWEWALRRLKQLDVPGLVIDLRHNGGGLSKLPIYMAGSFSDDPFILATQVYVEENGERAATAVDQVLPAPVKWKGAVAVLVGPDCVSACELMAAALARDPDVVIVGLGPTAGTEGGVFPWLMPTGIQLRAPLIGFEDDNGEIYLEGVGVVPTVLVPSTAETLRVDPGATDAVLAAAEDALLAGAAATPVAE